MSACHAGYLVESFPSSLRGSYRNDVMIRQASSIIGKVRLPDTSKVLSRIATMPTRGGLTSDSSISPPYDKLAQSTVLWAYGTMPGGVETSLHARYVVLYLV